MPSAAAEYILSRVAGIARPRVRVRRPPAGITVDWDVPVAVRDGTKLRVNVFRPARGGRVPVIMCAHPYGKDRLPKRGRLGYRVVAQYRMLRQPRPLSMSCWASWEAPDPAFWVPRGYAVINCDLRGCGSFEGVGTLLSDPEADDHVDLIEWAAAQPWSPTRGGLNGVSYLAISQYKAAAAAPPALAAICRWVPELERIRVPMLVCGSFSDHNLHSRGSFRAFEHAASASTSGCTRIAPASGRRTTRRRRSTGSCGSLARSWRTATPTSSISGPYGSPCTTRVTRHRRFGTNASGRSHERSGASCICVPGAVSRRTLPAMAPSTFGPATDMRALSWTIAETLELSGPAALSLAVALRGASDCNLFVALEKWRDQRYVPFEGSYGFGLDHITTGWLKLSHRALDRERSDAFAPVYAHTEAHPLSPGEIVTAEIALLPSATAFGPGDELHLVVRGRWPWSRHPITGQFPAACERGTEATVILHFGEASPARLLVPRIPR